MTRLATVIFLVFSASSAEAQPVPESQWTPRARLGLAASCVSEAGFDSHRTRECSALAHLYARRWHRLRARGSRVSFDGLIRQYSSPLRTGRRGWVLALRANDRRPRGMPSHLWELVRDDWVGTLAMVDRWYAGEEFDPCPGSEHFGSREDGAPRHWIRIGCDVAVRNRFYRVGRRPRR